mgnify:CR=1 FL=1
MVKYQNDGKNRNFEQYNAVLVKIEIFCQTWKVGSLRKFWSKSLFKMSVQKRYFGQIRNFGLKSIFLLKNGILAKKEMLV